MRLEVIGYHVTVVEPKRDDDEVKSKVHESSFIVKELDEFLGLTVEEPSLKLEDP